MRVRGGEPSRAKDTTHDLPDLVIRRTFNGAVLRAVGPLSVGLAGFYAVLATLAATRVLPPAASVILVPWTLSAIGLAILSVVIQRPFFRPEWAHPTFAVMIAFVLFNSALLMRTSGPPAISVVYILILLGTAIIVLSRVFYVIVAGATIATWAVSTRNIWPLPEWTTWLLVLFGSAIVGFASQVSREKTLIQLERARHAAQRLASIVEASHDAIIGIALDGAVLTWNRGATKVFGYTEDEAIGRHLEFFGPPNYRAELQYILDQLQAGQSVAIPETFRRARNGDLIPVAVSVAPILDSLGIVIGGSSVVLDLRPRKQLDEERSGAMRRGAELRGAQQLNRLKSDFINVAAHELYTPLTPIKLRIHQLRALLRGPEATEALAALERNVDRLQAVVDEIIQVAQVQGTGILARLEPTQLEDLVRTAVDEQRVRAKQHHQTLAVIAGGRTEVRADRERLKDAITNLVDNAVKFTPDGGTIQVSVETTGTEAIVGVKDSGPGLDPERLASLLQHFSIAPDYARRTEAGWGFGLFVSRRIIEAHGGRLWAHSEGTGKGATFFIALPLGGKGGPTATTVPEDDTLGVAQQRT